MYLYYLYIQKRTGIQYTDLQNNTKTGISFAYKSQKSIKINQIHYQNGQVKIEKKINCNYKHKFLKKNAVFLNLKF